MKEWSDCQVGVPALAGARKRTPPFAFVLFLRRPLTPRWGEATVARALSHSDSRPFAFIRGSLARRLPLGILFSVLCGGIGGRWRSAGLLLLAMASFDARADETATDADQGPQTAEDLTPEMRAQITVPPPDRTNPYKDGMRLTYEIGWSWFNVGTAIVTIDAVEFDGAPTLKFTLKARTNGFADAIYRVRNTTTAWVDPEMTHTLHYTNDQNEGKRSRDVVVDFNPDAGTVRYANTLNNDIREPIPIIDGTWDPMAITFFVSTLPLIPGERLVIPTTNGKELFLTSIAVTKKVEREFAIGRREAVVLKPDIKDLGGVFEKSDDSSVTFWFAAEDPALPLRMESEVVVGSFWAELVKVEEGIESF